MDEKSIPPGGDELRLPQLLQMPGRVRHRQAGLGRDGFHRALALGQDDAGELAIEAVLEVALGLDVEGHLFKVLPE